MASILEARDLKKVFRNGQEESVALNGVSLALAEGSFTAIMGPSGSGKSTLLFALSGVDDVTEGEVFFRGQALSQLSDRAFADLRRKEMGFVFQHATMLRQLNLLDNIILPAYGQEEGEEALVDRALALMARTGIQGLEKRAVTEVSGGQLQRAGICRALINMPTLLFADEPTGALNSNASRDIMGLFKEIHEAGTTILLVTHDAQVAAWADQVLFMADGRLHSQLPLGDQDPEARQTVILGQMARLGV